jgi:GNAT superfamily N-acetyltransferase
MAEDSVGVMGVPADVAFQAINPAAAGPEPPVESGVVRVLTPRFCLLMTPMPTVSFVEAVTVPASEVAPVVAEVRDLLRARQRHQAAWELASSDAEMLAALRGQGMTAYVEPPLEPEYTSMALLQEPLGRPSPEIVVRQAVELEDFLAIGVLAEAMLGLSAEDQAGFVESLKRRYRLQQEGRATMTGYLALLDGRVVGEAQAMLTTTGTNLSGSSVLPDARGRGVYRALVAARWDQAVGRGRPALTVQAGSMSRPILERLGFVTVSHRLILCDRFD